MTLSTATKVGMGAKTFGPHFRPHDFKGPLAEHYPNRPDLFQQLVGDLFREQFQERVAVSSTKGIDGAIDIFLESGPDLAEEFCNLPFPIIVECKDHDDSLGTLSHNIEQGWSGVQKKLARQAASGWAGTHQPWSRARGYLYCISAVLPNKDARDHLTQSIQVSFASLPPAQKPPIEAIHVLDWSDLASYLNRHARLADAWLGTALQGIVGHETYAAGLSGFRLYLKEEQLSFIPPAQGDRVHPDSFLALLQERESASPGILLIGPGGVGKTRTCFEVARLAYGQGWRVLHLLPGEPPVTASDLQEVVLQGCTPTLLVIDYLDQMGSLDFGTIRHRLLPEVQARSMPLAFLANARPGVLRKANPEREALFQRIDLDIRDRRDRITARVQATIAPQASEILGPARVQELCGTRPIIGMFIARELERYAREGKLDGTVASQLRHGDLQGWIRKRFAEDGLVPREIHPLLPAIPDPVMTAAAASFAAAPLSRPMMFRVISDTLAAAGEVEATATAGPLIASLVRSGWLEETGSDLTTPHDVITDELLDLTLCDRDLATVRPGIADKVFIGALAMPRVLGRFSLSLDRVMGQKGFPGQLLQSLKDNVSIWLVRHAAEMGQAFPTADPDEVSYALGAVLTGAAWNDAALRAWDDLIAPWLSVHGQRAEARHLLYRGLKELPKGGAVVLADLALQWIEVHYLSLDASYVIAPLLAREDLGKEQAQSAINLALVWLIQYKATPEAGFVFNRLLAQEDLEGQAETAINFALEWLTQNKASLEAEFVLHPLLAWKDLGEQTGAAINFALEWLTLFKAALEAGFVLPPLLAREDLGEQAEAAINFALEWLTLFKAALDAQFIFHHLLARPDLGTEQAQSAINFALEWLTQHKAALEAEFVLHHLLARPDLGKEQAQSAINLALEWLTQHKEAPKAGFVLRPLLAREDLGDRADAAINFALEWLTQFKAVPDAQFIFPHLLTRPDLGKEQAQSAINLALEWLTQHKEAPKAGFVLRPLLARDDLEEQAEAAINFALEWLTLFKAALDAAFVLPPLLAQEMGKKQAQSAITVALEWLENHFQTQDAEFVLKNLLGKSLLSPEEKKRCITLALNRLDKVIDTPEASYLLRWCLSERTLSDQEWKQAVERALKWLRSYPGSHRIDFVFKRLLRNPNLEDHVWREAADYAIAWLRRTPLRPDRDHTLNSLFTRLSCLTQEERTFLRQDAQAWLEAFPTSKGKRHLFVTLERLTAVDAGDNISPEPFDNLGMKTPFSLSDFLRTQVEKGELPDSTRLHQGLEIARSLLASNRPGVAAHYLSSLLPLAFRQSDPTFVDQMTEVVNLFLGHPDLTPNHRQGFTRALYRFLDRGAWPDKEAGERFLASLSIHRPPKE